MKTISVFKKKITVLSKMKKAYNALKIISSIKFKQYAIKREKAQDYLTELCKISRYEKQFKGQSTIFFFPCINPTMCGELFRSLTHQFYNAVRVFDDNAKVYLLGETKEYAIKFSKKLGVTSVEHLTLEEAKKKLIDHRDDRVIFHNEDNMIFSKETIDKKNFFHQGNYHRRMRLLFLNGLLEKTYYTSLEEENKRRSQLVDGVVKNIKDMIENMERKMYNLRQNKITNELAGVVSSMETI